VPDQALTQDRPSLADERRFRDAARVARDVPEAIPRRRAELLEHRDAERRQELPVVRRNPLCGARAGERPPKGCGLKRRHPVSGALVLLLHQREHVTGQRVDLVANVGPGGVSLKALNDLSDPLEQARDDAEQGTSLPRARRVLLRQGLQDGSPQALGTIQGRYRDGSFAPRRSLPCRPSRERRIARPQRRLGLIRFRGQWDYAADLIRVALSNSAGLT
jgi:hypothetical protein